MKMPSYEAIRDRQTKLAARPFRPKPEYTAPRDWTRKIGNAIGLTLTIVVLVGGIVMLLHIALAMAQRDEQIKTSCLSHGRVIFRGLCLEPSTVQKVIHEQLEFAK